ncbi:MAG TPA: GNAT family N-acetyltransferase [Rhizomicrobium sp.]|jgi:predicted N-acetyltransferase YhbS
MSITIRPARAEDASACGRICYEAFHAIATAHNFPPDFPSVEMSTGVAGSMIGSPSVYAVVAERDGTIVGSNFLYEGNPISGVGPITVDPGGQNQGVGARLMHVVMERSEAKGFPGIRLVQAGYHCRSLSLYAKLGFEIREHLSCLQGPAIGEAIPGYTVRAATTADIAACNALCGQVHGVHRGGEVKDAVARGIASVVEHNGRITGYTTQTAFFGHSVAETNDDLRALLGAASAFGGPGILVPSRNGDLLRWCLTKGLRITQTLTLMTIGLYNEPACAYLPSIIY